GQRRGRDRGCTLSYPWTGSCGGADASLTGAFAMGALGATADELLWRDRTRRCASRYNFPFGGTREIRLRRTRRSSVGPNGGRARREGAGGRMWFGRPSRALSPIGWVAPIRLSRPISTPTFCPKHVPWLAIRAFRRPLNSSRQTRRLCHTQTRTLTLPCALRCSRRATPTGCWQN